MSDFGYPTPEDEVDDYATTLLSRTYSTLRTIEKYCDWDSGYYEEAVEVKEAIGEYLWPDPKGEYE